MELYPLFSSPVLVDCIDYDLTSINNYLEKINYERYPSNNGYCSTTFEILLEEKFLDLKKVIEKYINHFLFEVLQFDQGEIKHNCSWINLHKNGDYAQQHIHTNSFVSGVLYLNVPETDGGRICFSHSNEIPTFKTCTLEPNIREYNVYNSKTWYFTPKNNMIIIFPSHLSHGTDKNNSNLNRYSLSFNYFIGGKLGEKTNFFDL